MPSQQGTRFSDNAPEEPVGSALREPFAVSSNDTCGDPRLVFPIEATERCDALGEILMGV